MKSFHWQYPNEEFALASTHCSRLIVCHSPCAHCPTSLLLSLEYMPYLFPLRFHSDFHMGGAFLPFRS
jgi:hypothetical protein